MFDEPHIVKKNQTPSWQQVLISGTSSITDAIRIIDQSTFQVAIVVGKDRQILGLITDGDIRRALLNTLSLDSQVCNIMNKNPMVCEGDLSTELATKLMQANQISHLPIVNEKRQVVGLFCEKLVSQEQLPNTFIVMAGGFGKRLQPLTNNCPKPMIEIAGKPMLEHLLIKARSEGFRHFVFAVHYLDEQIIRHFSNGKKWGVKISYVREKTPLGTAGALSLLGRELSKSVVVSNCDIVSKISFRRMLDFHDQQDAVATVAVNRQEWRNPFGVVETEGFEIVNIEEKPVQSCNINAGVYVFDSSVLLKLEKNIKIDMPDLLSGLRFNGEKTVAFPLHEDWLDVGRHEDLAKAQIEDLGRVCDLRGKAGRPNFTTGQKASNPISYFFAEAK